MFKRLFFVCCIALAPSAVQAQMQDSYLPSKSQLYFRFDGMNKHQAEFDKTAMGKMMHGDTGKFLVELWKFTEENLTTAAQNEPQFIPMIKDFTKLVGTMHSHGITLGVSVESVNPPIAEALLVFPKAAGESGTLLPLVQKIAESTRAKVATAKVGKRFVSSVEVQMVKFAWWAQGEDAVLFLGTTDPVAYAKSIDAKKTGLAKNLLYQKTNKFKEFPTVSRGFFDMTGSLKVASEIAPPVGNVINELGLSGMKSIIFVSGFDGAGERSVAEIEMPTPRKGLLAFTSQKKMTLKDLPVLPDDINAFAASTISLNKSYDIILSTADGVVRIFSPNDADNIKEVVKAFEGAVGVDIGKDLFGSFGDVMVSYSSPSDGIFTTGSVVAIKANDSKKLAAALEKLAKAIPDSPAGKIEMKRKEYLSGEIMQLQMSGKAGSQLATFGIYKDWFIYSQFPPAVKGFIMRQEGKLPAWKADTATAKVLAAAPKEFTGIQISDPRPTIRTALSIAPFALNLINSFASPFVPGYRPFDLDLIPHAQEATMHLFPNVTIITDDGKSIRTETRGSLLLPF